MSASVVNSATTLNQTIANYAIGDTLSLTVNLPPSLTVGNMVFVCIEGIAVLNNFTATGWVFLNSQGNGANTIEVLYRFIDGTEGGSQTFITTFGAAGTNFRAAATSVQYTAVNTGTPFETPFTATTGANFVTAATTWTLPSTTATIGSVVVDFVGGTNGTGSASVGGSTQTAELHNATNLVSAGVYTKNTAQAATGAIGTRTLTNNSSEAGSSIVACVAALQTSAPTATGGPTYTNVGTTTLTIAWTDSSTLVNYPGYYQIFRYVTSAGAGTAVQVGSNIPLLNTPKNKALTGLVGGTGYSFYMVSTNGIGSATSATTTVTTNAATTPVLATPTVFQLYGTSVYIKFSETSTAGNYATSFNVYRYVTSSGIGTAVLIASPPASAGQFYRDTGLTAGTGYSYYYNGTNATGTSANTASVATTTPTTVSVASTVGGVIAAAQRSQLAYQPSITMVDGQTLLLIATAKSARPGTFDSTLYSTTNQLAATNLGQTAVNGVYCSVWLAYVDNANGGQPATLTPQMFFNTTDANGSVVTTTMSGSWQCLALTGADVDELTGLVVQTAVSASSSTWNAPAFVTNRGPAMVFDFFGTSGATASSATGQTIAGASQSQAGAASTSTGYSIQTTAGTKAARAYTMSAADTGVILTVAVAFADVPHLVVPPAASAPWFSNINAAGVTVSWRGRSSTASSRPCYYSVYRYVTASGIGTASRIIDVHANDDVVTFNDQTYSAAVLADVFVAGTAYSYYLVAFNNNPGGSLNAAPAGPSTDVGAATTALTAYFSDVAATTVTTSDRLITTAPAVESNIATTVSKSTGYIELRAITAATAFTAGTVSATVPAPSGNGWLFDATTLEAKSIMAGTWSPSIRVSASGTLSQAQFFVRAYKRSSGAVYTSIGFFTGPAAAVISSVANTASTINIFTGNTGVAAMAFATGDKLYIDVIANVTVSSGTTGNTIALYRNNGFTESVDTPGYGTPSTVVAPNAPTIGTITQNGTGALLVHWTDSSTGTAPKYNVQRSTDQANWLVVATGIAAAVQQYNDTGLANNTLYYYRVESSNSAGNALSGIASGTTVTPAVVTGAAALASTSTLGGTSQAVTTTGAVAMSSTSALAADATVAVPSVSGASVLTSSSALGSSAGVVSGTGAAVLTSSSALSSAGTTQVVGAAALSSSSTLATAGSVAVSGTAVLSSSSTLASAAAVVIFAGSALSSTSAIGSVASVTASGTQALSSTSVLGSAATTTAPTGAAALSSASAIGSAGTVSGTGSVALASTSTLGSAATTQSATSAVMVSTSTLAASGSVSVSGAAALASTSTLPAGASVVVLGTTALTSTSALGATGLVTVPGASVLSSTSSLGAAGTSLVAGTAVLASTSTLGATPTTTAPSGASALTSTSTLGSAASTTELGASALTSTSSMSSAATTVGTTGGALTSTSTLGAAGTSQVAGTSALVSTSTLGAAAASATTGGVAALTSTSALGATALVKEVGAAALASTSALGSAASITEVDAAALSSASSLSPVATATTTAGAALASTSALGSAASATVPAAAVLASTSTLVSAGTETTTGVPALSSTSALAAAGAATVSGAMALSSTSALAVRTGVAGATTLTSTSALGAVGTVTTTGATALASTSALTAIGQEVFGAAALISQSTLGAATFFTITGGVTLRSTSMLAASADVTYVPPVFITGSDAALTSTSALGVTTSQAGTVALASTSSLGAALGPVTPVYAPNIPLASTSSLGVFSNPPGGAVVLQSFSFLNTPSTTPSTVQAGIALLSTSTMLPVDVFVLDRSGDMITLNLTNTGTIPQPGTLLVNVGNGRAYDTVSFSIDGVATGVTTQLDGAGTVTQMAIGVDGYSAGGHVITVTGVNGTSPQVSFVLDSSSPVLTPLPVGVLPPPVAVTAVQRWTFQAYNFSSVLAVPTYTFAINPTSLQQVFGEPRITSLPSTVINGMTFSWEGSPQALTWTAEGRTLTQADHDALVFWSQRNDRVWLTDEFLRRFLIKVDTLKMTRIRDVDRPWHHIYTMTFTVLAGAGVLI